MKITKQTVSEKQVIVCDICEKETMLSCDLCAKDFCIDHGVCTRNLYVCTECKKNTFVDLVINALISREKILSYSFSPSNSSIFLYNNTALNSTTALDSTILYAPYGII